MAEESIETMTVASGRFCSRHCGVRSAGLEIESAMLGTGQFGETNLVRVVGLAS